MNKTALLLACTLLYSTAAHAHRVWVETAHTHGGEYLRPNWATASFPIGTDCRRSPAHFQQTHATGD